MDYSSYISGCGSYLPKKILTNKDLSKKLDTSDEWIKSRTGIRQRFIADKKQLNSDLGYEAAKKALETLKRMNIDPAIASSVFVTTITDVIGFLSFLGIGAYFFIN